MRKLASLATRIALIGAATAGVVAACYNEVPGPSGPLPPTREVSPQGPRPKPLMPAPTVGLDAGVEPMTKEPLETSRVIEVQVKVAPQAQNPTPPTTPQPSPVDAGVGDVLDLPPIPDASVPLDAPGVKK